VLTKPDPTPCPICDALCVVENFCAIEGALCELTIRCPSGHYTDDYAYGQSELYIDGKLWGMADTTTSRVLLKRRIEELREEWQARHQ
jgi:uncharacterized radical SAM superfamily Fe-S cluster-containing enzyme